MPAGRLTDKEAAYCRYYVANGGNGTQAAISAGYAAASAGVTSAKLQKKPEIKAQIALLKAQVDAGTLHMLGSGGGGNTPPPLDGQVLLPGTPTPKPKPQTDPSITLTRQWIVETLLRNVAIAMGDQTVEQRIVLKARRVEVKAGPDGEPLVQETVDVVAVQTTDRNGAVANQALKMLDEQLEKLKAEGANVPQEATALVGDARDRLERMRAATKAKAAAV